MITSMIFFPDKTVYETPSDYGLSYEDVSLAISSKVKLHGWFLKAPEEKGVILFLHGNAGNISARVFKAKGWVKRGYSMFLVDYRGFGKSTGSIQHQDDVLQDASAALDWLMKERKYPAEKIVLYGESLGTHPAIRLAGKFPVAAVILEAPYPSFIELGKLHYPFVPSSMIQDFAFDNVRYIPEIKAPLFVLHGTHDEICPYAMSQQLFEKAPQPKEFMTVAEGVHNDLPMKAGENYWNKPVEFIERYRRT
ncbi:MAG TPA: alpha/beta fold hydrolase [Verrucomicrobiae bacterium]|nr:alpha/beta fold hydrolase [Verrucomicrobiae bacterium]